MIFIGAIAFRVASCIGDRCCKSSTSHPQPPTRTAALLAKGKRNLSEAVLPAFSAFLLLSYTKVALTPSYILSQAELIDEKGHKILPNRPYFAGHLQANTKEYILYYKLPACVVFGIFAAIPPLLLLDYPLRFFEWCLSKVNCLWCHYPVGKVHFFMDTFQGSFKNRYRCFAGLYFLFRLAINLNYTFTHTWLEKFVIKEIACILMIMLLSICQPYNKRNNIFNRIDVLIFTNLAIVNGLSFYLYEYAQSHPQTETLPVSAFAIQYILIFLPLIYFISYIVWEKTKPCHHRLPWTRNAEHRQVNNYDVLEESCVTLPPNNTPSLLDSNSFKDRRRFEKSEELFFQRAEFVNRYKPPNAIRNVTIADTHKVKDDTSTCLLYTSPSPRDATLSRMPSSA